MSVRELLSRTQKMWGVFDFSGDKKNLIEFLDKRKVEVPDKKPRLAKALWSMWRSDEQDVVKLKELAKSGRRIEQMEACTSCGGWQDVLDAKAYYSASYDAQSKSITASDKERLVAAASWTAIEGFFVELRLRKKVGKDSYLKLKDMRESV